MSSFPSTLLALSFGWLTATTGSAGPLHGVHTTTADLDRLKAWQAWTGNPAPIVGENFWATSWQGLTGKNPHTGVGLTLKAWRAAFDDPRSGIDRDTVRLHLSVPMFPNAATDGGMEYGKIPERWQQGADGKFNSHFRELAETLVAEGLGNSYLRLAWEFNVPTHWNNYAIRDHPEWWPLYVAYWRQVHRSMMDVEGARFRWVWCVAVGMDTEDLVPTRDAYPGDAFVDVIGVDFYDGADAYYANNYQDPNPPFELSLVGQWLWESIAHGIERDVSTGRITRRDLPCLDSYYAFARERGKAFGIDEWGVVQGDRFPTSWGGGGNDNPGFIESVHRWIIGRDVEYTLYFEYFIASDDYGFVDHSLLPDYWNQPGTEEHFIHPLASAHPQSAARDLELFHGKATTAETPPDSPTPQIEDRFDHAIAPEWRTEGDWTWRRGALFIEEAKPGAAVTRNVPDLGNRTVSFRIAMPASPKGVELQIGPYSIEFTRDRRGIIGRTRLSRIDTGEELDAGLSKLPHVIGKMYLPIRIEWKTLSPTMQTVSVFAGPEKILHHLDLEPAERFENRIRFIASEGTTVYLDDIAIHAP